MTAPTIDECCETGPRQLRCQLCPKSSTYWRRCPVCGRAVEPDQSNVVASTHTECRSQ